MRIIFPTLFIALFLGNISLAQNVNRAINQQDWIMRQQQNNIDKKRREKQQEAIKKDLLRKENEQKDLANQLQILDESGQCFTIKKINLIGANLPSLSQQKKLTSNFIGQCVGSKILDEIINKIQNFYAQKGYVLDRVFLPPQNIKTGNLSFEILEGKIEKFTINGGKLTSKMQEITAFGFIKGKRLNIKDIDQGIYQINRLSSNNAKMKISPGSKEGLANVIISNKQKFPAHLKATYDNLGNNFSGVRRYNLSAQSDNILSLNDELNLSYITNLDDISQVKDLRVISFGMSIPFAYNKFIYDFSRSEFRGTNSGESGPIRVTGFSQHNSFGLERMLMSEKNLRILGNVSLTQKSSASYLDKAKIGNSQRRLTILKSNLTISNNFKNGVNLYLQPSYARGLKNFDANKDDKNASGDIAKAQFEHFDLYSSLSKNFALGKSQIPLLASTEFTGQYSRQTLFGSEQISAGGYYSVRGFRENYINGDSGYFLRNKISLNLGSIIAPFLTDEKENNESFLAKNINHFYKISFEPFYDYGYVKNNYFGSGADGRLSGTGIKTIFSGKYFDASLSYSWGINSSSLIDAQEKENKVFYFEISAKCC